MDEIKNVIFFQSAHSTFFPCALWNKDFVSSLRLLRGCFSSDEFNVRSQLMSTRKMNFWGSECDICACTLIRLPIVWYKWKCLRSYFSTQGLTKPVTFFRLAVAQEAQGYVSRKLETEKPSCFICLVFLNNFLLCLRICILDFLILNGTPQGKAAWEYSFSACVPV